ncbi:MAG TPA: hypothetical protein VK912_10365 [Longimicrobiales bacterium]|nr:hypothetical protein [Longimicrobiales bacterium]
MSTHALSPDDLRFRAEFETCAFPAAQFDHRAHVRLAYVYLAENDADTAVSLMRSALTAFLEHNGVPATKYHETLTRAWILAVRHFMTRSPDTESADAFIRANPELLDTKIMLTHYSADVLFSEDARRRFVGPDLDGIPGA